MVAFIEDRTASKPHRNSKSRSGSHSRSFKTPYPRSIYVRTGSRFYSPNLHIWISRDPAAEKGFLTTHITLSALQHSFSTETHNAITEFIRMNSALYAIVLNDPVSEADFLGLISYQLINCKISYKYGCGKCMWDCSCPAGWSPQVASRPAPCKEQQIQTCYRYDTSDYILGTGIAIGVGLLTGGIGDLTLPTLGESLALALAGV